MPSKIVIVGPAKSGKKEFISGLTLLSKNLGTKGVFGGVPSSSPPPVDTNEVTATSNTECASITTSFLLLETKYYSAPLELLLLPSSEFASPASKQAKEALLGAEALIVVADSDALSKDADAISPFFSQMGALLDLIKGNSRKEEGEEKDGGGGGGGGRRRT